MRFLSTQAWPGSRATRINTIVAYEATQEIKRELLRLAARELDWPEEGLTFAGDEIRRTDQEAGIRWTDLLARTGTSVTGRAHIEERGRSHITSFAVQVAEVAVDPETGEVKVLRFTTAHDVGQIVNPIGHQGQIDGAIMQGIGYALTEELQVEDGQVTNPSFGEYKLPTMPDTPPLTTVLVESANGVGPYQIKGIGESRSRQSHQLSPTPWRTPSACASATCRLRRKKSTAPSRRPAIARGGLGATPAF